MTTTRATVERDSEMYSPSQLTECCRITNRSSCRFCTCSLARMFAQFAHDGFLVSHLHSSQQTRLPCTPSDHSQQRYQSVTTATRATTGHDSGEPAVRCTHPLSRRSAVVSEIVLAAVLVFARLFARSPKTHTTLAWLHTYIQHSKHLTYTPFDHNEGSSATTRTTADRDSGKLTVRYTDSSQLTEFRRIRNGGRRHIRAARSHVC